ncbi:hypothetical protein [uncultured Williamsia sp.]|nr:hypothetical protein [uncultured Williamsia sp.]
MPYTAPTLTELGSLAGLTLDKINKEGRKIDGMGGRLAGNVIIIPS